jgi:hypothetical protein
MGAKTLAAGQRFVGRTGHPHISAVRRQHPPHRQPIVLVGADDQYADTVQRRRAGGASVCRHLRGPRFGGLGRKRKHDHELRTSAFPIARDRDLAAVKLREALRNRQSQAESAMRSSGRRIRLSEALEDVRKELARDALTRIEDGQLSICPGRAQHDADRLPLWRELQRIREQVPDNLVKSRAVAHDQGRVAVDLRGQLDAFRRKRGPQPLDDAGNDSIECQLPHVETQPTRADPAHVEQFVDDAGLRPRVALDHGEAVGDLVGVRCRLFQQMRPAQNRIQGSPQLV